MRRPNVILLTVDSLRYDAVFKNNGSVRNGLAGFRRLVDAGTSFDNAWATGPYTRASVPSIISGSCLWTYNGRIYESKRPHIAEAFNEIGYGTGGLHSNPFLDECYDWDRGFDYYFNGSFGKIKKSIKQLIFSLGSKYDLTRKYGRKILSLVGRHTGKDLRAGDGKPYVPADVLHNQAIQWIQGESEPVFLWIHYMDVHNPWYPHKGTESAGMNRSKLFRIFSKAREDPSSVTEAEEEKLNQAYQASVQSFDKKLNSFINQLENLLDDSVICLTSDHGELLGEYDKFFHPGLLKKELLRIPLIFSDGTKTVDRLTPVSTVDIMPTLVSIAGKEPNSKLHGRNLSTDGLQNEEVFASARDNVRIISNNTNDVHCIPNTNKLKNISRRGKILLSQLRSSEPSDSLDQFDDEKLTEQLEALGYK